MSKKIVDQSYLLINMINLLGKIKPSMGLEPCKQKPRSMHEILFTHILIFGERGISFLPIKFLNSKYLIAKMYLCLGQNEWAFNKPGLLVKFHTTCSKGQSSLIIIHTST